MTPNDGIAPDTLKGEGTMILPMDIRGSEWLHLHQGDKLTTIQETGGLPTGTTVTATGEYEKSWGFIYIGVEELGGDFYHLSCFDLSPYLKPDRGE